MMKTGWRWPLLKLAVTMPFWSTLTLVKVPTLRPSWLMLVTENGPPNCERPLVWLLLPRLKLSACGEVAPVTFGSHLIVTAPALAKVLAAAFKVPSGLNCTMLSPPAIVTVLLPAPLRAPVTFHSFAAATAGVPLFGAPGLKVSPPIVAARLLPVIGLPALSVIVMLVPEAVAEKVVPCSCCWIAAAIPATFAFAAVKGWVLKVLPSIVSLKVSPAAGAP